MKKTIISIIGIAIMLLAITACQPDNEPPAAADVWDGTSADTSWYTESGTTFTLDTAAKLAGLAELAVTNDFNGKTITLTEDIDLNGNEWTPIGTEEKPFNGIIKGDGNGIEIKNLKMTKEVKSAKADGQHVAGFIGFLGSGTIENLTFTDASISVGQDVAAGAAAGYMHGGTINNVNINNADIYGTFKSDMGAIAGKLYDSENYEGGSITNCKVTGVNIILDAEDNEWESCNIGGIVGGFSYTSSEEAQEADKAISGNTVDLSGDINDRIEVINFKKWATMDYPAVGGIIGQIGGGTKGTVSSNTLIIADVTQIGNGHGSIVTGYPQEFYGFDNNKGICGDKTWKSSSNYDSGDLSKLE